MRIFLLPGFDGTGELFAPLIDCLEPQFRCTTIRYSDHRTLAGYVSEAAEQIGSPGPACLVAESFSGPVAVELLSRGEHDFVAAVLCTTFARPPMQPAIRLAAGLSSDWMAPPVLRSFLVRQLCLNGVEDDRLRRRVRTVARSMSSRAVFSRLAALAGVDVTDTLAHIHVPVLVLGAIGDRLVRASRIQGLAAGIPEAEEHWIAGPHLLLQARPRECAEHIRAHVQRLVREGDDLVHGLD